ncbi:MAG TPA: helix-turn-helix transcriptional regulator [Candidatus Acidoferrum sp.]|nr:helix-turn-helix transcriptional regulator [Candidatus Acidoferrum sp.]
MPRNRSISHRHVEMSKVNSRSVHAIGSIVIPSRFLRNLRSTPFTITCPKLQDGADGKYWLDSGFRCAGFGKWSCYCVSVMDSVRPVGDLLREWRLRRRMSQLHLATEAEISSRHLSFLETGRSRPSRDMLLHLAEQLQVPLRERNVLLKAAGFASFFPERQLTSPALEVVRRAIDVVLAGHSPFPAFAIDRHWTLVASNGALKPFLYGVDPQLLLPPVNVMRLTLNPGGLGPRLANYHEWRAHVLDKLRRLILVSGDPVLVKLLQEFRDYPVPGCTGAGASSIDPENHRIVVPFQLRTEAGTLSFFSTTTVFGTPVDVTLSELSLESFYPADAATADAFRKAATEERKAAATHWEPR